MVPSFPLPLGGMAAQTSGRDHHALSEEKKEIEWNGPWIINGKINVVKLTKLVNTH